MRLVLTILEERHRDPVNISMSVSDLCWAAKTQIPNKVADAPMWPLTNGIIHGALADLVARKKALVMREWHSIRRDFRADDRVIHVG